MSRNGLLLSNEQRYRFSVFKVSSVLANHRGWEWELEQEADFCIKFKSVASASQGLFWETVVHFCQLPHVSWDLPTLISRIRRWKAATPAELRFQYERWARSPVQKQSTADQLMDVSWQPAPAISQWEQRIESTSFKCSERNSIFLKVMLCLFEKKAKKQ